MRRSLVLAFFLFVTANAHAAIRGTVISRDGAPVKGATVSVFAPESTVSLYARLSSEKPERVVLATVASGDDGRFSLEVKSAPTAVVEVKAPGFAPTAILAAADDDLGTVALRKAELKRGTVTADGKPIAGALVVFFQTNGAEYQLRSDENGTFAVPAPDEWQPGFTVIQPGFARFARGLQRGMPLDVKLQEGVRLSGRVVAEDGKSGVAGATLLLDDWPVGKSGDDGASEIANAPVSWKQLLAFDDKRAGLRTSGPKSAPDVRLSRAATLSGVVVDAKTNLPVVGALAGAGLSSDFGAGPLRTAVTDAKGRFTLAPVVAANYRITLRAPLHTATPAELLVRGGEAGFRRITASPLARISGFVRDEEKRPIAGASVITVVVRQSGMAISRQMVEDNIVHTAGDGSFVFRTIDPDSKFELQAKKRGMPLGKSGPWQLTAAEKKSGVVVTIPNGIEVRARVTNTEGAPIAGASIDATPARIAGSIMFMVFARPDRQADLPVTNEEGIVTFQLAEGQYDLTVRRDGYGALNRRGITVRQGADPLEFSLSPAVEIRGRVVRKGGAGIGDVMVRAGGFDVLENVSTAPDGSFVVAGLTAGRLRLLFEKPEEFIREDREVTAPSADFELVIDDGGIISGRVIDREAKSPVPDFRIGPSGDRAGGGAFMRRPGQLRSVHSDDGSFVVDHLTPGATTLVVEAPGFVQAVVSDLVIPDDKPLTNVEIALERGVKLFGKVTGPDGAPLSGAGVTVSRDGDMVFSMGASADAAGEYVLEGERAGEATVTFSRAGFAPLKKSVKLAGTEMRVDAQLSAGKTIAGTVVSEAGAPVADANIAAMFSGRVPATTRSDANGAFRIEGLESGRLSLRVGAAGYAPLVEEVDVDTAGSAMRLVLKSGGVIVGRVSGLPPEELARVTVTAYGEGRGGTETATDPQGSFRLEGAPLGNVRVYAYLSGGQTQRAAPSKNVEVTAGVETSVDLEFESGATMTGRVTRNGTAVSGARITYRPADWRTRSVGSGLTDSRGSYEITGLARGDFLVEVQSPDLAVQTFPYTVSGPATYDIALSSAQIRGRVVDSANGEPISDAAIELGADSSSPTPQWPTLKKSGTNGAFLFDSVGTGTYTLRATKAGYGQATRVVTVGEGGVPDVELELERSDGVVLSIVDGRSGKSVNAWVRAKDGNGIVVFDWNAEPKADGTVRLPLARGNYSLRIYASGMAPTDFAVSSPSSGGRVVLTPGGDLQIVSKRAERAVLRLVTATGIPFDGGYRPDERGEFPADPGTSVLRNIPPGAYTLQILNEGNGVEKSLSLNIAEGQTTTTEI